MWLLKIHARIEEIKHKVNMHGDSKLFDIIDSIKMFTNEIQLNAITEVEKANKKCWRSSGLTRAVLKWVQPTCLNPYMQ
jgi:hypothetical protein